MGRFLFVFIIISSYFAGNLEIQAQFENDLGSSGTWDVQTPPEKKEIPFVKESACDKEKILQVAESEKCVMAANPSSCYYVAASQIQKNRSGQYAAAGMLGLALTSPNTRPAAIQDHVRIKQALLVQSSFELEFKKFAKNFISGRIEIEREFRSANELSEISKKPGESEPEYLERLMQENKKSFSKLDVIQRGLISERANKSIISWEDFRSHSDAKVFDQILQSEKSFANSNPEAVKIQSDHRIEEAIRTIGSRSPNDFIRAINEIEIKISEEYQKDILGDSLVKRRQEAQARVDLFNRGVAEAADPTFEKESREAVERIAKARRELQKAKASGSPLQNLMAEKELEFGYRDLWKRVDQNVLRVQKAMADMRAKSVGVQPALQALMTFDGSSAHLQTISDRLDVEFKKSGIEVDAIRKHVNPPFIDELRTDARMRRDEIRRREIAKQNKLKQQAGLATAGLGLLAAPGLSFGKSQIIKSCAEKLNLSDREIDFLLKQNPEIAVLDKCEDLRLKSTGDLLRDAYVEFGRVPKGLCDLSLKQSAVQAIPLNQPLKTLTCQSVDAAEFKVTEEDGRKKFRCNSRSIAGLYYEIPVQKNGKMDTEGTRSFLGKVERPMPASELRFAFRQQPTTGIGSASKVQTFEMAGEDPSRGASGSQDLVYANYLSACEKSGNEKLNIEACSCVSNMISTHAIETVQSQYTDCADQTKSGSAGSGTSGLGPQVPVGR